MDLVLLVRLKMDSTVVLKCLLRGRLRFSEVE